MRSDSLQKIFTKQSPSSIYPFRKKKQTALTDTLLFFCTNCFLLYIGNNLSFFSLFFLYRLPFGKKRESVLFSSFYICSLLLPVRKQNCASFLPLYMLFAFTRKEPKLFLFPFLLYMLSAFTRKSTQNCSSLLPCTLLLPRRCRSTLPFDITLKTDASTILDSMKIRPLSSPFGEDNGRVSFSYSATACSRISCASCSVSAV